jgi:hypothetical protein
MRGFLLPSRGSPGRSISRFSFSYGFYLLPAAFTSWAFSPFFPQDKMYPDGPPNGQTRGKGWMSGVLRCKSDTMKGADDGSATIYRPSRCFAQGSPEKAMKCFSVRKGGPTRINDNECLRG